MKRYWIFIELAESGTAWPGPFVYFLVSFLEVLCVCVFLFCKNTALCLILVIQTRYWMWGSGKVFITLWFLHISRVKL